MVSWAFYTSSAVAMALAAISPAAAQTNPDVPDRSTGAEPPATPPQAGAADSQTAAQADEDAGGIREIVVTAQRRSESIQRVPVAVSALDAEAIEKSFVEDIRDFAGRVPSLVIDPVAAGPSAAAISIRGISFEDIEKSFDPAVGVVVDGVFVGTNTGQLLDAFDVERLEVLRGPQGTLFGRNTIGGVINVQRTRPTRDPGLNASVGYSSFDSVRGRAVANTGTLGGIVALKPFVFYDTTEGFYRNVTKNRREGEYRTLTGGITALVTPGAGIEAIITYEHMRERGETVVGSLSETGLDVICLAVPLPGGATLRPFAPADQCDRSRLPDRGLYTVFQNVEADVRNDTDAVSGQVNVELGGFDLVSITGYRTNSEDVRQDFDATSVDFFSTRRQQDYEQFSQELRVVGDLSERINLLLGAYYFTSNYQLLQRTRFGPGLLAPVAVNLRQDVDHDARSYAAFADTRIKPIDNLTVGLGIRYTRDRKKIFNNFGAPETLVANGQCLRPNTAECEGSKSFGKLTYRASVDYQIDKDKLAYVSYSRGFRSGGFNGRAASPTSLGPYEPETVDAYEVGFKADWLNRRLRTNFAVYRTDYNNKQEETVQPTPPGSANPQETVVQNAASARIQGAEAEIIVLPFDSLSLRASFTYTDAEYIAFFNDVNGDLVPDDVSTLELRRAPKYQASVGADFSQEIGQGTLDLSTTLRFQDSYFTCIVPARPRVIGQIVNDPRCETRPRETLDASASYTFGLGERQVRISAFGRNLTDNRDLSSTLPVAGLFTFGTGRTPRSFGVEAGVRF